ncbi:hypothetical protein [Niveispirillum sp. BGYR6]|uniref:hypothetical protein n=1 Tax=Niveispirillum sp. BGYR6 TaxID=2971249 RepID=UPI0022B9684D|nr:hypothetical protein [Niveispirillum sp. BGYR6]MDG5497169.1 hypothetical protein [Niveispirillum sp. BGYR6]
MRRMIRQGLARTLAVMAACLPLGGCLLGQSATPLLPTGEALPHGVFSRDMPSGLGDTLTVREETMRIGSRYVVSGAGGRVGSVAFARIADADLSRLSVPGGEARALYLAQVRLTGEGLQRLDSRTRLPAALKDEDAERYAYLPLALVRQGTDAPTLVLMECSGPDPAALLRKAGPEFNLRFSADGLLRIIDRAQILRAINAVLNRQLASGSCRAERRLELSPHTPLKLP